MDSSIKESKIYSYITIFALTCIISLFLLDWFTDMNTLMGLSLKTIRHIFWDIMLLSWGTEEIFIEKRVYGYIWYIAVLTDVIKFVENYMNCDLYNLRMFSMISITALMGYKAVFIEKKKYGYIYFTVTIFAVGAVYKHFFST